MHGKLHDCTKEGCDTDIGLWVDYCEEHDVEFPHEELCPGCWDEYKRSNTYCDDKGE